MGSGKEEVLRYTTPGWMASCLRSVRVSQAAAATTAELVKSALAGAYAHGDLVKDTAALEAGELAASGLRDRLPLVVHAVKADVAADIDRVLEGSVLAAGGGYHNAFDFHYGMAEALGRLHDFRTYYVTPFASWSLLRVVGLWPQLDPRGRQVGYATPSIVTPDPS